MNFAELLTAVLNTLLICWLCVCGAVPLGCTLALLLQRTNVAGRNWAWIAISSQLALPLYVIAGGWSAGLGFQGWMRSGTGRLLGLEWLGTPLEMGFRSLLAVSAIHAMAAIPGVCLIISLGLVWTRRSQEELALNEGGPWHWLRFSLLPKLRIWVAASCLWCVVPVLTEMVVTNLFQVTTVAERVYLDASRGTLSPWTYVAAVALCMLPILAAGACVQGRLPSWTVVMASVADARGRIIPLGRARVLVSLTVWLAVAVIVGLPSVNLLIKAGWQPSVDATGRTRYGWSLARLLTTAYESLTLYVDEVKWSMLLAGGAAGAALTVAGALIVLTGRGWQRLAVSSLALLMIAVPGPLAGMLVIALMNRSWPSWLGVLYDTTLTAPIIAQQFRLFPLAWLLSLSIRSSVSGQVWQQAAMEGLNRTQLFSRVLWPQTWKLWLLASLILVVTSLGELSCSILVLPPGVTTLSMRLFEMLHFGMRHQDSGLCGLLMVLGWLVALVSWKTLTDR